MEPNKKNGKSMKTRDKHIPLVDAAVIDKQISFQHRLVEYQRQLNVQPTVDFDEERFMSTPHKKSNSKQQSSNKILRGNLGFCYLDMSLVNLCGIPSLWMDPRQFATAGAIIQDGSPLSTFEPYIKLYQRKLLKKQFKVY